MFTVQKGRLTLVSVAAVGAVVALAGCASSDPLAEPDPSGSDTVVIGSQDYYSNEIIAEIYAQALEANDFTVEREFRIGQREVYLPEVEDGTIDLFPEYTGNLLEYYDKEATAKTSADVYAALQEALPEGLQALDQSSATDQDSYNVTAEFAGEHNLSSLEDLASVTTPLTLGGNSELETRPYGPDGLKEVYGVSVGFTPIEDSGGPLTIKALLDNDVQLVDIYSADPKIAENDLVTLDDPKGLFLASNVVPIASDTLSDDAATVINKVSNALTADDLVQLNTASVTDKQSADTIAAGWLEQADLF